MVKNWKMRVKNHKNWKISILRESTLNFILNITNPIASHGKSWVSSNSTRQFLRKPRRCEIHTPKINFSQIEQIPTFLWKKIILIWFSNNVPSGDGIWEKLADMENFDWNLFFLQNQPETQKWPYLGLQWTICAHILVISYPHGTFQFAAWLTWKLNFD